MFSIEKMMEQSDIGCAKHKMIYDAAGNPVDYYFQAVNLEKLTGLKREALLNRRVSEVMPNITNDDFDWIGYYAEVVKNGKKHVFEQYAASLDRWYRVECFSCEKDCFTTLFTDITHERELVEASKAFLDDEQKANTYEEMTQRMRRITGSDFVALNVFMEDGEHFRTVAIEGVPGVLQKAAQMLGFNPQKKEWPPDPHRMALIREKTVTTFDHLHELTDHVLPKTAIKLLEKTFNLGKTVVIKSMQSEKIIGDFTLMFSKGNELQNENEAIIYADMVGMLIEKRRGLQKLAEKEKLLKESKQQLDTIISNSPSVIYTYRIDNHNNPHITFINGDVKKILGYDPEVFINNLSFFKSNIHPDDLSIWQKKIFGDNITCEYRFKDKTGTYHWIYDKQKILKKDTDSVEIIGSWWDITEKKEVEQRLKNSEQNFNRFFQTMDDLIFVGTTEGKILYTNEAVSKKLGYTKEELQDMYILDVHPQSRKGEAETIFAEMFRGERNTCPLPLQKKSGDLLPVETKVWFGKWNDKEVIYGISKDLSQQQAALDKFTKLFDSNPALMTVSSIHDGKIIDVNHAFLKTLGYDKSEVLGRTSTDLNLFVDPDEKEDIVNELKQMKSINEKELKIRTKDGKILTGLFSSEIIDNQNEKVYLTVMTDITKKKEIQAKLRENQIRLELAMDAGEHGYWEHIIETNKMYFSPGYFKMLGYKPDELPMTMETWVNLIHPEDKKNILPQIDAYVSKNQPFKTQLRLKCKDGSYKWITSSGKNYYYDKQQKAFRVVGTHVDIDELKRKNESLNESHRIAKMGRWDYYHQQDDLQWSDGVFDIFEIDPKQFDGNYQAFIERVHPHDRERVAQAWKNSVANHQAYDIEHKLMLDDGRVKWVKEHCYTEYDETGYPKHSTGIIQDITELNREKEKAQMANQAKSMFLANMNHELRTPLNGIIGFSDILRTMPLEEDLRGIVDIIYTSGKHLSDIITDILDFSRIEAGKLELNTEKTELKPLIENTLSMVRSKAEGKGLSLYSFIENDVPETVEVDGSRLRQVLINLIANAVKFTDKGSVSVSVSLKERQRDTVRLLFKVTDTGMGIRKEDQKKIFEPFQQADMTAEKKAQGTGLGLPISKKMLELMGTSLELESEYRKGSTFSFELELSCERPTARDTTAEDITQEDFLFKNKKVLIVEDDPVSMQYAQTALAMLSKDIQVMTAENGEEGYEQYRKHLPDLILMDICMPKLDGYQATAMIRSHSKDIPIIIAMTAKALEEDKEKCMAIGMNEYLTKPVSLGQLKEILKKYL
ncbi:MAG TPA: PAS domain-containing protein [Thermotogota bacterium]|nr:PAS domain-containing protein [Thermotogota bacterium]